MGNLSIGDRVCALDGSSEGKLVDIDGSTAYVMQANGVETEFPLSRLKAWAPPAAVVQRTLAGPLRDTSLSPEKRALLASVPAVIMAAVAKSYAEGHEPSAGRADFAALPPSKQLDVIRIHLPTLPRRVLAPHMKLVLAVQALAKPGR